MPSGARLIGGDRMAVRIQQAAQDITRKVAKAQRLETEVEATESKRRCPVDTGNLRDTIHATGPTEENGRSVTSVVCGGPAAPYAIYVHEDLEAFHPVGEAKFIESTLRESAPYMRARIAARARLL